jgi:hypothetical protein
MNEKITLVNMNNERVIIDIPDLKLKREFAGKGKEAKIDREILQEALYSDPGLEYMIKQGILYIDNLKDKIYLGLEPEDVSTPVNITPLTNAKMLCLLKTSPSQDLKTELSKITAEQRKQLVDFAIEIKLTDFEKCEILKEFTEVNVLKIVKQIIDDEKEALNKPPLNK